jgi:hypothetical protein
LVLKIPKKPIVTVEEAEGGLIADSFESNLLSLR